MTANNLLEQFEALLCQLETCAGNQAWDELDAHLPALQQLAYSLPQMRPTLPQRQLYTRLNERIQRLTEILNERKSTIAPLLGAFADNRALATPPDRAEG